MPQRALVCPSCGRLNSERETTCFSCGARLPGPLQRSVTRLLGTALGEHHRMTKVLAGLCAVPFVLMLSSGGQSLMGSPQVSQVLKFGGFTPPLVELEPWRLLAAVFVHFGALHFGMNLLALLDLGRFVELRLGSARMVIVFIAAGVFGFAASWVWYEATQQYALTAGASGGIFGLMGAVVAEALARRDPQWKERLLHAVAGAVLISLIVNANNAAHAGGFATGALLGYLFAKESRPWRRTRWLGLVAGGCLLASAAAIALSVRSPVWQEVRKMELQRGD